MTDHQTSEARSPVRATRLKVSYLLTLAVLLGSISIESTGTVFASKAFGVIETPEALPGVCITAAGDHGVDVVVADTRLALAAGLRRRTKIVLDTLITVATLINRSEHENLRFTRQYHLVII